MAEAEDVIADVARHATDYAQRLWRRHRGGSHPSFVPLPDVVSRVDLFVSAALGRTFAIRVAQARARPTLLARWFGRRVGPKWIEPVPATDGVSLWLPPHAGCTDSTAAAARFRTAALSQAMRAWRGSASLLADADDALLRDVYLLLEACATDRAIVSMFPGMASEIDAMRRDAMAGRPPLAAFGPARRALERLVRCVLTSNCGESPDELPVTGSPIESLREARRIVTARFSQFERREFGDEPMWRDWWTGDLRAPPAEAHADTPMHQPGEDVDRSASDRRSARLLRRPEVRKPLDGEDGGKEGAWMIQTAQPLEQAEDPAGLRRPIDRDRETSAESFADALSELPEARLVTTPGPPKEVLLSDDPPERRLGPRVIATDSVGGEALHYPEWDFRVAGYRHPGAIVRVIPAVEGARTWVDRTRAEHRAMLDGIRRRFEMLRPQRTRLRRQLDGDDIDLEGYLDAYADYRAGRPMPQALYRAQRRARRDMAILLLIDVSGSTDGWVSAHRRIIDVEREALLLVSIALDGLGEAYSVQAFSGEGPDAVSVRAIKRFDEAFDDTIARRIAALEPERYTRAGAAIRHATALLMQQVAEHRLLLVLSDGKPNDVDEYDGRYGVEDMRQSVVEARMQGIQPFCLTIDRLAPAYLGAVFGTGQYALLPRPEPLPVVLLDWMKRLVAG